MITESPRFRQLNDAQKQAVTTIDGPVMVVAGPGTGKTELLGVRTAYILEKTDALPQNILLLTFTDSGVAAMRQRLVDIIGKDAYRVAIHTFHSFGTEIINQHREHFYNGALFEPADDLTRYEIIRGIFSELDYSNPLSSTMNGQFTHQRDAETVISELKRNGISSDALRAILDQNELALDAADRIVLPLFADRISKKTIDMAAQAIPSLQALADEAETIYEITPLIRVITDTLHAAVLDAQHVDKTGPLTAWKNEWLATENGERIFKARKSIVKLRALTYVYNEYLLRMEKAGLYDYDDMVLQVVQALEANQDLRLSLQEKYLYLMVDEYQDTNFAQMRIMNALADNPVNEGKPNLLVVGDDDQAIYSFQGADISNILRFSELYPSAQLVTLTTNYRSGKEILTEAREVITQGSERLESRVAGIDKQLIAHQKTSSEVRLIQTDSSPAERHWLIQDINDAIKKGAKAGDIAVLVRKHAEVEALLPYFAKAGLAVQYERRDNALDEAPVQSLELLAKVVVGLAHGDHDDVNALMPQLLAHPAWGIDAVDLWRLSSDAYDKHTRWIDAMAVTPVFVPIHEWLVQLAQASHTEPLESMLDMMIGRPDEEMTHVSPFYNYYFSDSALVETPSRYIDYLTALQTIRRHLRDYRRDSQPHLDALVGFLALHRQLGSRLSMVRIVGEEHTNAVKLMTAHKSKGLEFEHVYIVDAVDSMWGEKSRSKSRTISYPHNLPIGPRGDDREERLRLFFVAMTRAKQRLTISFSSQSDGLRELLVASFLSEKTATPAKLASGSQEHVEALELAWHAPLTTVTNDLRTLLAPQLQSYKLSATHLNTFLDVSRGGPHTFLMNNLLHFPSAKSAAAAYGSAMHRTLQLAHFHVASTGEQKPAEDILHDFERQLDKEQLSEADHATYLQKGSDALNLFLEQRPDAFTVTQKAELNFAGQDVHIDDAHITGMLDVADLNIKEKTMTVTDYKTGTPIKDGRASSEYDKIKLHKYKQQLMFYKLLVEGSRDYHDYTVTAGELLFVEPNKFQEIVSTQIAYDDQELAEFRRLIATVWQRIQSLDLPDISDYEPNLKGILAFEADLLQDTSPLDQ